MLLPRPASNDTVALISWDTTGGARRAHICLSFWAFGVIQPNPPLPPPTHPPHLWQCRDLLSGEVNPDVRAGSCSAQQGNALLRLRRVRADEPAETHGQTGGSRNRQERGEGGDSLFRRIEPSPLLFPPRAPCDLPSRFGWGESRARRVGPGVLFLASPRMTARCHPRATSATTDQAAPWACGAAR